MVDRSGYVSLVGRPNVGKSTLLNALLAEKVSIVSHKPQTTRRQIYGIKTTTAMQMVLIDTPGIHSDNTTVLNRRLNQAARAALQGVDCRLWVLEAGKMTEQDERIASLLRQTVEPLIVLVNKIDRIACKDALLPFIAQVDAITRGNSAAIVPISALKKDGLTKMEEVIYAHLPRGGLIFPEGATTHQNLYFLISEIVREKLIQRVNQELPYGAAVVVESYEKTKTIARISAVVIMARKGHKKIVIGGQGETIKWVSVQARKELETILKIRVYLRLWVKVQAGWINSDKAVQALGFTSD